MTLHDNLKEHHLILASGSPRRRQFLEDLGLQFEIRLKPIEEIYPETLTKGPEIAEYLARLKTEPYRDELGPKDILITGDTLVWAENQILHKPKNKQEAIDVLSGLSGKAHQVISACCLRSQRKLVLFHGETTVFFNTLTREEVEFYIDNFRPYDKAGGYAIQEWIGKVGIEKIEGSFYTVMGMPVSKVYAALKTF